MLRGVKTRYEDKHRVRIEDGALVAAVKLGRRYVAGRALPDKAIDLLDEAGSRLRLELDSHPDEIDALTRRERSLQLELAALARERDVESVERLQRLQAALRRAAGDAGPPAREVAGGAGRHHHACRRPDRSLAHARARGRGRRAGRRSDPGLRDPLWPAARAGAGRGRGAGQAEAGAGQRAAAGARGRAGARGPGGGRLDRHPGDPDAGGRAPEDPGHRGEAGPAGDRPGRGGAAGGPRGQTRPGRPGRRRAPHRVVPVPGPHRRGQDRADQGAGRVPVRRRTRAGAPGHVGVHGEARGGPADRGPARVRRLRGGRPADRGRAPPSVFGGAVRRGGEGPPGRVQRVAGAAGRRAADRQQGAHRQLRRHRADHDLEPGSLGHPGRRGNRGPGARSKKR